MIDHCKPVERLFIACPSYTGAISTETAHALMAAIIPLTQAGVRITHKFGNGGCYLDEARNQLVADFLASDATDLLFVDADVGFVPATVLHICMSERPIVGALYPKKGDTEAWPVEFFPGSREPDSEGLVEVKMMPTGLMRINRAVFGELKPKRYTDVRGREIDAYFRCDIREFYFGEDVEFCRQWRETGGRLRIVPDATLAHWGMKSWIGNAGDAMKAGRL